MPYSIVLFIKITNLQEGGFKEKRRSGVERHRGIEA
jgi:hypothetical protein